ETDGVPMSARSTTAILVVLAFATSACDHTPIDPLDEPGLATITGEGVVRPSAPTLHGLLYAAIGRIHSQQGADAAHDLVRGIAAAQQDLDRAPVSARPSLR